MRGARELTSALARFLCRAIVRALQALRLRRYLMAAGASLLAIVLLAGMLCLTGRCTATRYAYASGAIIALSLVAFLLVVVSPPGLTLAAKDPQALTLAAKWLSPP
jgi:hypothetical protein